MSERIYHHAKECATQQECSVFTNNLRICERGTSGCAIVHSHPGEMCRDADGKTIERRVAKADQREMLPGIAAELGPTDGWKIRQGQRRGASRGDRNTQSLCTSAPRSMSTQPENLVSTQNPAEGPRQFRKKPIVIEAYQMLTAKDAREGVCTGGFGCKGHGPEDSHPHIHTLEGDHTWTPGDWVIRGVQGEYYFCKPDIFAATYEPAAPTPPVARCEHCGMDLVAHHSRNLKCPNAATVYRATPPVAPPIEARDVLVDMLILHFGVSQKESEKIYLRATLDAYYAACRSKEREACAKIADACTDERRHQLEECWPASRPAVEGKLSEAERIAEKIRQQEEK